jgi:hypothetical protein
MVAAATYKENLTIGFNLKLTGSSASTTIIDGGLHGTVLTISSNHDEHHWHCIHLSHSRT